MRFFSNVKLKAKNINILITKQNTKYERITRHIHSKQMSTFVAATLFCFTRNEKL